MITSFLKEIREAFRPAEIASADLKVCGAIVKMAEKYTRQGPSAIALASWAIAYIRDTTSPAFKD